MIGRKPKEITYKVNENGCHICNSHTPKPSGYIQICINYKNVLLHRYFYEQTFGEIKKGNVIRHTCDNRGCINPKHLVEGTQLDNIQDMLDRDRSLKGIKHPRAKLSEQQVIEIVNSDDSDKELAQKYKVSQATILNIRIGKTWTHITK